MFYAASEIIFWIFLAAIVGGGIGYGLSQAKSVKLNQRLTQSKADAPMERELAIAWDTIEDLNRRLQVAHETIRGSVADLDTSDSRPNVAAEAVEAPTAKDSATVNLFVTDASAPRPTEATNGTVGSRLSERVASASAASAAAEEAGPPAASQAQAK